MLERALDRLTQRTIYVCRGDLERALEVGAIAPAKGTVILNGYSWGGGEIGGMGRESARRRLGLPSDRAIAVAVGRLHRQKDHPTLLAALALLKGWKTLSPLTLIVGDGPDRQRLEAQAKDLGLDEEHLRFLGTRDDVPVLLGAADFLVMSSLWEGLPYVLLEAMAAGVPIVATDVGGNREVVEDRVTGRLVPPRDPARLAEALAEVLEEPKEAAAMGRRGVLRLQRGFGETRMIEETLRAYRAAGSPALFLRRGDS